MFARKELWYIFSGGAALSASSSIGYEDYLGETGMHVDQQQLLQGDEGELKDDEEELIVRDLGRVRSESFQRLFAHHGGQVEEDLIRQRARRILVAFKTRNKNLGYVQGHHNISLVLLSEFHDLKKQSVFEEERAFWVFCAICETVLGRTYYSKGPIRMEGLKQAIEIVNNTILDQKFEAVQDIVDKGQVVGLVCMKWLVQIWADDDIIRDIDVLKRLWDCIFLSAAGCSTVCCPPSSALKAVFKNDKYLIPSQTDFHIRMVCAMINDTPIVALSNQDGMHDITKPIVAGHRNDAPTVARLRAMAGKTSSHTVVDEGNDSNPDAEDEEPSMSPRRPLLHRKTSLEEMGSLATGHIFSILIDRVKGMTLKKLEELIVIAENTVLIKDPNPDTTSAETLGQTESDAMIKYIRCLSKDRNLSAPMEYGKFKTLALESCPKWTSKDAMHVFASLDFEHTGIIVSSVLIENLTPERFPDIPPHEFEKLATAIYLFAQKQAVFREEEEEQVQDPRIQSSEAESCSNTSCTIV